ncbi:MAG: hypothetical protein RQ757_06870 [Pseudomonadales bacterium]|nr:hypothetical protein [Pseudomonadales bacterium]
MKPFTLTAILLVLSLPLPASAATLDSDSPPNQLLESLSPALSGISINLASNLNLHPIARAQPETPVLGALADLPPGFIPSSGELQQWASGFAQRQHGVLAILPASKQSSGQTDRLAHFWSTWQGNKTGERIVVSFAGGDEPLLEQINQALRSSGFLSMLFTAATHDISQVGPYYVSADHRWVVDSLSARDIVDTLEFSLLGKSVDPDTNLVRSRPDRSARRLAASEPEVFLKDSLGDEFEASTISEIIVPGEIVPREIVPGGIALGETAVIEGDGNELVFNGQTLFLRSSSGDTWQLPEASVSALKTCFDFAQRAVRIATDAVVDIDQRGRVRVSAAMRDTEVGYQMALADLEPFKLVQGLPADKSIILDTGAGFYIDGPGQMEFMTDYEVRFLRADRRRIAQTRVALQYHYDSSADSAVYEGNWGSDTGRLRESTDFDSLGENTANVAGYAAWVALFRKVLDQSLDFTDGFYEFLSIDNSGQETPVRL